MRRSNGIFSIIATGVFAFLLVSCVEEETGSTPSEEIDVEAVALTELYGMTENEREDLCELYAVQGASSIRELPWNFAEAWYEEAVDEIVEELRTNCP